MRPKRTSGKPFAFLAALACLAVVPTLAAGAAALAEEPAGTPAMGRATFRVYCASCHGSEAHGDGSVAEHLRVPPADLTRIAARNDGDFPTDEVGAIIDGRGDVRGHGDHDMPVWGDAFRKSVGGNDEAAVAAKIRDLTAYLASIQVEE